MNSNSNSYQSLFNSDSVNILLTDIQTQLTTIQSNDIFNILQKFITALKNNSDLSNYYLDNKGIWTEIILEYLFTNFITDKLLLNQINYQTALPFYMSWEETNITNNLMKFEFYQSGFTNYKKRYRFEFNGYDDSGDNCNFYLYCQINSTSTLALQLNRGTTFTSFANFQIYYEKRLYHYESDKISTNMSDYITLYQIDQQCRIPITTLNSYFSNVTTPLYLELHNGSCIQYITDNYIDNNSISYTKINNYLNLTTNTSINLTWKQSNAVLNPISYFTMFECVQPSYTKKYEWSINAYDDTTDNVNYYLKYYKNGIQYPIFQFNRALLLIFNGCQIYEGYGGELYSSESNKITSSNTRFITYYQLDQQCKIPISTLNSYFSNVTTPLYLELHNGSCIQYITDSYFSTSTIQPNRLISSNTPNGTDNYVLTILGNIGTSLTYKNLNLFCQSNGVNIDAAYNYFLITSGSYTTLYYNFDNTFSSNDNSIYIRSTIYNSTYSNKTANIQIRNYNGYLDWLLSLDSIGIIYASSQSNYITNGSTSGPGFNCPNYISASHIISNASSFYGTDCITKTYADNRYALLGVSDLPFSNGRQIGTYNGYSMYFWFYSNTYYQDHFFFGSGNKSGIGIGTYSALVTSYNSSYYILEGRNGMSNSGTAFYIDGNGNYYTGSNFTKKNNIIKLKDKNVCALDCINKIEIKTFKYNKFCNKGDENKLFDDKRYSNCDDTNHCGVIADDIELLLIPSYVLLGDILIRIKLSQRMQLSLNNNQPNNDQHRIH